MFLGVSSTEHWAAGNQLILALRLRMLCNRIGVHSASHSRPIGNERTGWRLSLPSTDAPGCFPLSHRSPRQN